MVTVRQVTALLATCYAQNVLESSLMNVVPVSVIISYREQLVYKNVGKDITSSMIPIVGNVQLLIAQFVMRLNALNA
jgi:hypothetical protein